MQQYQAYLFDMDGTLVNSEPLKGTALMMACKEYGADVDAALYKAVMGNNWSVVTDYFFQQAQISPELTQFNQRFRYHYEGLLSEQLELLPGAVDYLLRLRASGKKCALVSSAAQWMVDNILSAFDLIGLFDVVITQQDVTRHKPHPEAYLKALSQLKVDAHNAVIFEDSNAGIEAGVTSGCDVVAIQHAFNHQNNLDKAIYSITSYHAL